MTIYQKTYSNLLHSTMRTDDKNIEAKCAVSHNIHYARPHNGST